MAVDYVSKWIEVIALPINNAKVVVRYLKKYIFARFDTPRTIISDGGSYFYNNKFKSVLVKYHVKHKVVTAYHSQINSQVKVSN